VLLCLVGKETDRVAVHAQVVLPGRLVLKVDCHHLECANLVERVNRETACGTFNAHDAVLAVASTTWCAVRRTSKIVIFEEGIQSGTVYANVLRVDNAKAKRVTDLIGRADRCVDWVVDGAVEGVRLLYRVWRRLPVRCLGLDIPGEDVPCAVELILVEGVVLHSVPVQPNVGPFNKKAATSEDGNTSASRIIQIMVSSL
jgi:hypothetical protein